MHIRRMANCKGIAYFSVINNEEGGVGLVQHAPRLRLGKPPETQTSFPFGQGPYTGQPSLAQRARLGHVCKVPDPWLKAMNSSGAGRNSDIWLKHQLVAWSRINRYDTACVWL